MGLAGTRALAGPTAGLGILLCALSCLAAPTAQATWIAPVPVSNEGLEARDPQVAVDGAGNITVAWVSGTSSHAILVAERPAGGQWSPGTAQIAATSDCHDPKLDVSPAGAAILVADCKSGTTPMRSTSRSVNGTWSGTSIEIPGSGSGNEPRVALDDAGNAVVVWASESNVVESSYKAASGGWEAVPLQVSPAGKVTREPAVAVSPTGRAIAIWLEDRDETMADPVVQVNSISRQGGAAWSGYKFLSGTTFAASPVTAEPELTINAGGRIAAWRQLATSPNPTFLKNAWGSAGDFSSWGEGGSHTAGDSVYGVEAPQVALDSSGRAVAAWRAFKLENGDFGVQAATTNFINGSWSSPVTLAAGGGNVGLEPDVEVDPAGDAIIAWGIGGTVSAVRRAAGGTLSPNAIPISNPAHSGFEQPRLAIDGNGDGVATWSANYPATTRIEVAIDDVTPPLLSAIAVPANAPVGIAAAMSAAALDDWSALTVGWDFGDGASATGTAVSHAYSTAGTKTVTITATDALGNTSSQARQISITAPAAAGGGGTGNGGSKVKLSVTIPKQSWDQIAKAKAVKLRCKLDVAGSCAAQATVNAAVAKRIGLAVVKGKKNVKVGSGSHKASAGKFVVVEVGLTAKARAAIAAATRSVPLTFTVSGKAAGHSPTTLNKKLVIPRP